jgi:hypothetical protein
MESFICIFVELLLNFHFKLLQLWMEDIIYLLFYNTDVSLIETLVLGKDFTCFILNHFFVLCNHLGVLKILRNQFLSEFIK